VTNGIPSLRIYLKTLGQVHGTSLKGHDLLKLFDARPAAAHAAINTVVPAAAQLTPDGQPTVRDGLAELDGVFVEWRYLYEKPDSKEVKVQHCHVSRFIAAIVPWHALSRRARLIEPFWELRKITLRDRLLASFRNSK